MGAPSAATPALPRAESRLATVPNGPTVRIAAASTGSQSDGNRRFQATALKLGAAG